MNRGLLTGLLIFSLALNVAVAASLAWYLWIQPRTLPAPSNKAFQLSKSDYDRIRDLWRNQTPSSLREKKRTILQKKAEILDIIEKRPNDTAAMEKALKELLELTYSAELVAMNRIRVVSSQLPEDRRKAFLEYLRTRACPGMGMGRGHMHGRGRGPCSERMCPHPNN